MHKEMIDIFFLLQTHIASTWTAKISSLEHVLHKNLAFGGCPSKETNFCGSLKLPNGLGSNMPPLQHSKLCGTKTIDNKRSLRVKQSHNLIISLKQNLLASK